MLSGKDVDKMSVDELRSEVMDLREIIFDDIDYINDLKKRCNIKL